ncbi:MAG: hypothetical protein VX278_19640 [Myxococcota bacterium]|nr:hypothetical protein [Myxococcota bacterium]
MKQYCPICQNEVPRFARYPRYICHPCGARITDEEGRSVYYVNTSAGGGCQGYYQDDQSPYNQRECYVGSTRCIASEARFGGIVIQVPKPTALDAPVSNRSDRRETGSSGQNR